MTLTLGCPSTSAADMSKHILLLLLAIVANNFSCMHSASTNKIFFNGFTDTHLKLFGQASISNHAIRLTKGVSSEQGEAFYSIPLSFSSDSISSSDGRASFSTTFVFAITADSKEDLLSAYGMTFVLCSNMERCLLHSNSPCKHIDPTGMCGNYSDSGSEFFLAIELSGIDNNHIEIHIKSWVTVGSHTKSFYSMNSRFQSTELISGKPMQVWVDYDTRVQTLNVTLEEFVQVQLSRPQFLPQFSSYVDNLSSSMSNSALVYAGFSASAKSNCSNYVVGWSFMVNEEAQPLNSSILHQVLGNLPSQKFDDMNLPNQKYDHMGIPTNIVILTAILVTIALLVFIVLVSCNLKSWVNENFRHGQCEIECGLPFFTYKDLFVATIGFNKMMLLGKGGFGRVYKGVLSVSKQSIAIKRISPESMQGMKEFMAEIAILGQLRHRNLVQLMGYCHHREELLLVYDYMPNGSLDTHLYSRDKPTMGWAQRLSTIKGVASGLWYLHEDWEQVVIHRDIKTSNVLLDAEMNAKLGDFGLARLHGHESDAHTTRMAGTWGYISPELARLGKATKATDVYAFGIFMLEVVCVKKPIEVKANGQTLLVADWVLDAWQSGSILDSLDTRLEEECDSEEVELVLKLGLICSHSSPKKRPCMRLVMQYLLKDVPLPDFLPSFFIPDANNDDSIDEEVALCPSVATSITDLSGGR